MSGISFCVFDLQSFAPQVYRAVIDGKLHRTSLRSLVS